MKGCTDSVCAFLCELLVQAGTRTSSLYTCTPSLSLDCTSHQTAEESVKALVCLSQPAVTLTGGVLPYDTILRTQTAAVESYRSFSHICGDSVPVPLDKRCTTATTVSQHTKLHNGAVHIPVSTTSCPPSEHAWTDIWDQTDAQRFAASSRNW